MNDFNLENLASKKLYNQWSKEVDSSSYLSECSYFPYTSNIYVNISDVCRKLLRNLEGIEYGENEEFCTCGLCKLLNYWLYDQVKQIISPDYINQYTEIITDLHAVWSKYKIYKSPKAGEFRFKEVEPQCKPENLIQPLQDIKDKKLIHEHCLNYYGISKNSSSDECRKYKVYIQSQSLQYENFERLFAEDKSKCPNYYNQCESYDPKNIVNKSNCPQEIAMPDASEEVAVPLGQSSLGGGEVREEGEVEKAAIREERRGAGGEKEEESAGMKYHEKDRESEMEEVKPLPHPIIQLRGGSADNDLSGKSYEGDMHDFNHNLLPHSTDNGGSNGTIVSASCVGLTGFLFLLYKFTPLRTVLDPRIRKTKNVLKDGVQGSNELQSHDYDFYPPDVDINRYNISYQSR